MRLRSRASNCAVSTIDVCGARAHPAATVHGSLHPAKKYPLDGRARMAMGVPGAMVIDADPHPVSQMGASATKIVPDGGSPSLVKVTVTRLSASVEMTSMGAASAATGGASATGTASATAPPSAAPGPSLQNPD